MRERGHDRLHASAPDETPDRWMQGVHAECGILEGNTGLDRWMRGVHAKCRVLECNRGRDLEDVRCPLSETVGGSLESSSRNMAENLERERGKPFAFGRRCRTWVIRIARRTAALTIAVAAAWLSYGHLDAQDGFRFRSGVELVNVTVTVTDRSGRFVPGLTQTDFVVYDDDQRVDVTHFSADRVPVSLGIVLDTSGSMAGDKIERARASIERFLDQLRDPDDEVFLYGFASDVRLIQDWTTNRDARERRPASGRGRWRHGDVRRRHRGGAQGAGRT